MTKRDVYKCYLKVKENPKTRYMKRLKNYCDKLHQEFKFLTDKNLRDQVSCIDKSKV